MLCLWRWCLLLLLLLLLELLLKLVLVLVLVSKSLLSLWGGLYGPGEILVTSTVGRV